MRRALVLLFVLTFDGLPQQPASISAELQRTEAMIAQLTDLKAKVSVIEGQLDELLKALAEQKGALQNPKSYNALEHVGTAAADDPDKPKPAPVRCAALTSKGGRCTRPAVPGSRYCKQHQMVHSK